ncbi:hypothetical protein KFE98_07950 [bacterium SCSIO 12741]|nr:hypothetical protein KFE98_07950 [bacterium SCSIO 12741]
MIRSILGSERPSAVFFSAVLGVVLLIPILFSSDSFSANSSFLLPYLGILPTWLDRTLALLVVISSGIYGSYLFNKYEFFPQRNLFANFFIPAMIALGGVLSLQAPWVIGAPLLLRFADRCLAIQRSGKPNHLLFDAASLTGLLSLIYYPFIGLLVLIWVAYLYSGSANIKGFVITLITPLFVGYLVGGTLYLFGLPPWPEWQNWSRSAPAPLAWSDWLMVSSVLVTWIFSLPVYLGSFASNKVVVKNHLIWTGWFWLILTAAAVIGPFGWAATISIAFAPIAFFFANLLMRLQRAWLSNALFILLFSCWMVYLYANGF